MAKRKKPPEPPAAEKPAGPTPEDLARKAGLPLRRRILELLLDGPRSEAAIAGMLWEPIEAVQPVLQELSQAGLVKLDRYCEVTQEGKTRGYELPSFESLVAMRQRGGNWAAYQNQDLGSRELGHMKFLKFGEGCTLKEPPRVHPDTATEINWRYQYIGNVDLEKGEVPR